MSDDDPVYFSIHNFFDNCLEAYKKIVSMKNLSPIYNQNWEKDGDLLKCFEYMKDYISQLGIKNIQNLQILQESGVTPALFFNAPNPDLTENYTILFISHIDKIPFGDGWNRCDPNNPIVSDGYLYGRGSSTSMYALFTILSMITACEENKLKGQI